MLLHEKTLQILQNIEKYYPQPPGGRPGYIVTHATIVNAFKTKYGTHKYTIKALKRLPIEQIKNATFIKTLKLEPHPKIYGLFAYWGPISRRYGWQVFRGKKIFYFTLITEDNQTKLVTCEINQKRY